MLSANPTHKNTQAEGRPCYWKPHTTMCVLSKSHASEVDLSLDLFVLIDTAACILDLEHARYKTLRPLCRSRMVDL